MSETGQDAAEVLIFVCAADEVVDGGPGKRFPVTAGGEERTGFVIRFEGEVYGYLNRCAHVPIELDWREGEFFESGRTWLMCSTHGALYLPDSGQCAGGPCRGGGLRPIRVHEKNGSIYWEPDDYIRPLLA